jgi:hypothetical protein
MMRKFGLESVHWEQACLQSLFGLGLQPLDFMNERILLTIRIYIESVPNKMWIDPFPKLKIDTNSEQITF